MALCVGLLIIEKLSVLSCIFISLDWLGKRFCLIKGWRISRENVTQTVLHSYSCLILIKVKFKKYVLETLHDDVTPGRLPFLNVIKNLF